VTSDTQRSDSCPSCGHTAAPEDRFCSQCGFNLTTTDCPSCHTPNDAGAKFCTNCGNLLAGEVPEEESTDQPPIEPPTPADVASSAAPPAPETKVEETTPPTPESQSPLDLSDVRAPIPESIAAPLMPFESRRVPTEGMAAWTQPDANAQPETQLGGGTDLVIIERTGAWAHVMAENGWKGWVDDRLLVDPDVVAPSGAPSPASWAAPVATPSADSTAVMPKPAPSGTSTSVSMAGVTKRPLTAAGAAAAIVSIFLPWFSGFSGINAFDVPVVTLFNVSSSGSDFSVGLVLLVLGGFCAAVLLVPRFAQLSRLLVPVGIGIMAMGGLFLFQIGRLADVPFSEVIAAGPVVAIVAGVLVLTRR